MPDRLPVLPVLLLLVALLAVACASPDVVVDEPLPEVGGDPADTTSTPETSDPEVPEGDATGESEIPGEGELASATATAGDQESAEVEPTAEATVEPTVEPTPQPTVEPTVEPTPQPTGPVTLASGNFRAADDTVSATGTAALLALEDGSRILRFEAFEVSAGPDLYVILVPRADVLTESDNSGYVDLGLLKGNIGNQNYPIPPDLDVGGEWTVVVWCKEFDHNFGIAPLN